MPRLSSRRLRRAGLALLLAGLQQHGSDGQTSDCRARRPPPAWHSTQRRPNWLERAVQRMTLFEVIMLPVFVAMLAFALIAALVIGVAVWDAVCGLAGWLTGG